MVKKITVWCMVLLGTLLTCSANAMPAPVGKPIFDSVCYYLKIDTAGVDLGYLRMDSMDLTLSVDNVKGRDALWKIVEVKYAPESPETISECRFVNVATSDTLRFAPVVTQSDTVAAVNGNGILSFWYDPVFNEGGRDTFKTSYEDESLVVYTYYLTMNSEGVVMLSFKDVAPAQPLEASLPPVSGLTYLGFSVERATKIPDEGKFYRLKVDTLGAALGFLSADTTLRRDSLAVSGSLRGDLSLWKLTVDTVVYDTTYFKISNKATDSILAFDIPAVDTVAYMKQQGVLNQWMIPFFIEDNGIGKFLVRDTVARKDYYLALKDTVVMLVSDTAEYRCLKFVPEDDFLVDTTQVYKVKYLNGADSGKYLGANARGTGVLLDTVYAHLPDGQFVVYETNKYALMSRSGAVTTGRSNSVEDSLSVVCGLLGDTLPYQYTNRVDTFEIMPVTYGGMETRKFNPYLGYGRPDTVGLDLSAFVISYASTDTLNGRVMGYEHSDSLLVLLPDGDTAQFVLGVSGIYSGGAPEIAGIPRLERLAYHLRAHDDTTLYISVRANDSIAMDTVPHQASFFLKEDTVPDVVKYYFVENMPVERKLLVDSTKHFNPVSIDSVDVHLFVLIRKERYPAEEDPYEYLTYEELLENFSGPGLYEFSADIVTYHRYLTKNFYDYAFLGMEGESMLRAGSYMPSDFHLWIDTARGPGFNPLKPSFYIVKEVDTIPSKFNISGYFLHVMDSTSLPDHDEYVVKTIGGDYEYNRLNFVKANRYSGNELLLASSVALRARDSVGFAGKNEDAINEYRFYLQKTDNPGEYYIVTEQGYGQNGKRGYLSVMDGTNNTRLYVGPRSDSYARPLTVSVASRVSNETVLPPKPEETSKKIAVIGGDGQVAVHNALGESVTVFNVLGQRIADKVISSDRETIPVSRGILIVKVGGSVTQKVVVK